MRADTSEVAQVRKGVNIEVIQIHPPTVKERLHKTSDLREAAI